MHSGKESKLTARIDHALYDQVKDHFHHGQQTQFFRQVFDSLKILIDEGRFGEVTDYLYKDAPLVLPTKKEVQR